MHAPNPKFSSSKEAKHMSSRNRLNTPSPFAVSPKADPWNPDKLPAQPRKPHTKGATRLRRSHVPMIWLWVKKKSLGDHRNWSIFPFTKPGFFRVPVFFNPHPYWHLSILNISASSHVNSRPSPSHRHFTAPGSAVPSGLTAATMQSFLVPWVELWKLLRLRSNSSNRKG